MSNTIALAKVHLPLLDAVYAQASLTSILDAPESMVRATMNANEILIPKMAIQGLGDYSRNGGFVNGDVDLVWETHAFTQMRGRSFSVDAFDNIETVGVSFGMLANEFIRSKVGPEIDAYRIATIAGKAPVGHIVAGNLDATTALQAIDTGIEKLQNAEVNVESVVQFVTPTIFKFLKQSNLITRQFITNVGRAVLDRDIDTVDGRPLVVVPQSRMYSAITTQDGSTAGEEIGGYVKAVGAKDVNFALVDTNAVLAIKKTALPRIFDPETNQKAYAWKFDYLLYHDIFVPDNKKVGVYVHTVA